MKITVRRCARCGEDHEVEFQPFQKYPFEDADGVFYEWWGMCPATNEPVLMRTLEDGTDAVEQHNE